MGNKNLLKYNYRQKIYFEVFFDYSSISFYEQPAGIYARNELNQGDLEVTFFRVANIKVENLNLLVDERTKYQSKLDKNYVMGTKNKSNIMVRK